MKSQTRRRGERETRRWAIAALVLNLVLIGIPACKRTPALPAAPQGPFTLVIPAEGAYTGAYIDFGDNEDEVTLEGIESFEKLVGKHQAIVASSSYWGEQSFPTANLDIIRRHHAIPLVFWSPWDRPYHQEMGPDRFSLESIIAGKWDAYIDQWGDAARDFGHPLLVSFANEMNGTWFPWSGWFNGAMIPVEKGRDTTGPWQGPEAFKKAYRHVVDRVRARGAANVLWVFHTANYSIPAEKWNAIEAYYPGPEYVDWIGCSVYGQQFRDDPWNSLTSCLDSPYRTLCTLDPQKPLILAEWGVGEFPASGSKPAFIKDALETPRTKYPRIKAAVFWNERWQNGNGEYSNLRANSSPESLAAYRAGVGHPFWLGEPILVPAKPQHGKTAQ